MIEFVSNKTIENNKNQLINDLCVDCEIQLNIDLNNDDELIKFFINKQKEFKANSTSKCVYSIKKYTFISASLYNKDVIIDFYNLLNNIKYKRITYLHELKEKEVTYFDLTMQVNCYFDKPGRLVEKLDNNGKTITKIYEYYNHGELNNLNDPSIVLLSDNCKIYRYFKNNRVHRIDGPAEIIVKDNKIINENYYINGKTIHPKTFLYLRYLVINNNINELKKFFDIKFYFIVIYELAKYLNMQEIINECEVILVAEKLIE